MISSASPFQSFPSPKSLNHYDGNHSDGALAFTRCHWWRMKCKIKQFAHERGNPSQTQPIGLQNTPSMTTSRGPHTATRPLHLASGCGLWFSDTLMRKWDWCVSNNDDHSRPDLDLWPLACNQVRKTVPWTGTLVRWLAPRYPVSSTVCPSSLCCPTSWHTYHDPPCKYRLTFLVHGQKTETQPLPAWVNQE